MDTITKLNLIREIVQDHAAGLVPMQSVRDAEARTGLRVQEWSPGAMVILVTGAGEGERWMLCNER